MKLQLNEKPYRTIGPAVTTSGAYCPVSYWHETVSVAPGAPLAENIQCDVAIVGGGFTGLSNAIALKTVAPSLDVVLLEHSVVGHGASGRNGGFAMPLIGWDLTDAAHKLGEEEAGRAYRLMYDAVEHLRRTVREHNIACDMEETGYLLLATSKARLGRVRHEVELGKRLGFDLAYLDGDALREHISSASFIAGAYDPHPFIVNPAKLARGLKAVAERLGVRVFEQSPVVTLDDGKSIALTTRGGRVAARAVVLAMNGYGGAMGFYGLANLAGAYVHRDDGTAVAKRFGIDRLAQATDKSRDRAQFHSLLPADGGQPNPIRRRRRRSFFWRRLPRPARRNVRGARTAVPGVLPNTSPCKVHAPLGRCVGRNARYVSDVRRGRRARNDFSRGRLQRTRRQPEQLRRHAARPARARLVGVGDEGRVADRGTALLLRQKAVSRAARTAALRCAPGIPFGPARTRHMAGSVTSINSNIKVLRCEV